MTDKEHEDNLMDAESAMGEAPSTESFEKLEAELKDAEHRYLRAMADFDNYRKRTENNARDIALEGKRQLVLDLLAVMDNFQLAIEHGDHPAGDRDFLDGIHTIYKQLQDVLSNHGAEVLDPLGEPFDPNFHEVLDMVGDAHQEPMTISKVYKKGYLFHDKLLRRALVQVVREP